jgi:hypothetical protein
VAWRQKRPAACAVIFSASTYGRIFELTSSMMLVAVAGLDVLVGFHGLDDVGADALDEHVRRFIGGWGGRCDDAGGKQRGLLRWRSVGQLVS